MGLGGEECLLKGEKSVEESTGRGVRREGVKERAVADVWEETRYGRVKVDRGGG